MGLLLADRARCIGAGEGHHPPTCGRFPTGGPLSVLARSLRRTDPRRVCVAARGDRVTPQEKLELRVLDHIYSHDQGVTHEPAGLSELFDKFGEEPARSAAASLSSRGLADRDQRMSGGYHITPEGKRVIEELRDRQGDRGRRRVACREQMLTWLDRVTDQKKGLRVDPDDFDGELDLKPFDADEIAVATEHLHNRGLIGGIASWSGMTAIFITEAGREAVDAGGVQASEQAGQVAPGVVQTFNLHGHANTVANATADGANATANVDASTFNLSMAKAYAAMVRSMGSEADLDDDDRDALVQIEEAQEGGDLSRSQRAMAHLYSASGKIATGAAGGMLATLGKQALGING